MSEDQEEKLTDLLDQWEQAVDVLRQDVPASELCRMARCPELANELSQRIRILRGARRLERQGR